MAHSPLLGGDPAPRVPGGRSTDVLGPSDTSDSGSDVIGADLGDADLDADSDAGGTGERAEAGRDTLRREAPDISTDQVVRVGAGSEEEAVDEPDALADMAANEEDEDLIDSDLDDDQTTRPPAGSALPKRQRNTDRAVASGEDARGDGRSTERGGMSPGDPVSERDKSIDA